jgi:N-acetylneuraminic acid mutarotase
MPTGRSGAAAQVVGSNIYVAGGMAGNGASVSVVEIYNPTSNSWSTAPSMGTRRDNPGSASIGGKLYVFGGRTREADGTVTNGTLDTVEMYDPGVGSWVSRAPMLTGRRTMVVGNLNGRAQVMGGEITQQGDSFTVNEEYDPVANSWRTLTPMTTGRHGAVAGTINGVVYVVGGGPIGGGSFTNVNEAFSF